MSASQRAEGQTEVVTPLLRRGLVVGLLIGGDQLTKWAVRAALPPGHSVPVIPSILHLTHVQNTGAAFGLFQGYPQAFAVLAVVVAVWVVAELARPPGPPVAIAARPGWSHRRAGGAGGRRIGRAGDPPRPRTWPADTGLLLILGGALGNLIDRIRFGYVIDFLDLRVWPVFNLADSAITIGVGLLLWHAFRRRNGVRSCNHTSMS